MVEQTNACSWSAAGNMPVANFTFSFQHSIEVTQWPVSAQRGAFILFVVDAFKIVLQNKE